MADEAIRVEGDTRLAATLRIAASRIRDMSDPGDRTARFIAGRGRADAPVRTGRLASSIRSAATTDEAEATSGLAYANRTHWGFRRYHQRAQPFLADAVWNNGALILSNYTERAVVVLRGVKGA
jgi:hypothetical protein